MEVERLGLLEILNSRTDPTVEAVINGAKGKAPSGASDGTHESSCHVPENLRERNEELRESIVGENFTQEEFDHELENIDGTGSFERLGAASIASSFAFWNAQNGEPVGKFPYPLSNVVGGGEHGGNTSIQEFLVLPLEAESFPEAVRTNAKIYRELKKRYSRKVRGINDEGALITSMDDEETLRAVKEVADSYGARVGLDVAANELYSEGKYQIGSMQRPLEPGEMLEFIENLIEDFELCYVEDPFHEDDFSMHSELTKSVNDALICGDDLFVTQAERLQTGISEGSCDSLIVKPNQAGTVSRARETLELAKREGYAPVVSHRSGETCDHTISDLSLEWGSPIIKAGIADIRIAKLNRLIELWEASENPEMAEIQNIL